MKVSVIVPALDEEAVIGPILQAVRAGRPHEVIVADGGSSDGTAERAREQGARVVESARGRARQMNAGARAASGDVLLFLHADTRLPQGYRELVEEALQDPRVVGGRFDVELRPSSPLIRLTGELINLRSRLSHIATGDQAIFVRRRVFQRLGGYPDIPLMEDIAFSRALKSAGRIACLSERVTTSSRRWVCDGVVRTILLMWTLRVLYFCGVPAQRLARVYRNTR